MKRLLLPLALAGLFVVACKPAGPSLDGSWTMTGGAFKAGETEGTLTFSGNNIEMNMTMTAAQLGSMTMTAKGTYTLEKDALTTTFTSAKADFSKVDASLRPVAESTFKEDEIKEQMNKNTKSTIKFINDNEVEMKNNEGTVTLKRK